MGRLADAKHQRLLVEKFLPALSNGSSVKWSGVDLLQSPVKGIANSDGKWIAVADTNNNRIRRIDAVTVPPLHT